MITLLAGEWRIVSRDAAVRWSAVLLLCLTMACLWNGANFKAQRDALAEAETQRAHAARMANAETVRQEEAGDIPQNMWGPSNVTRASWNAARPSGPLASLSFGREDIDPLSANVSLWMVREDNLFQKYEFGSPLAIAAGRFDAGFLIVLLLPLFVLALVYNVIAQERESGRLKLALIQGGGVRRRLVLRAFLRLAPVWLCLMLIGAGALWFGAPPGRLALWWSAALLYLLFWFGAGLALATLRLRQETLALTAAGAWLFVVVLLPAAGSALTKMLAPTPPASGLIVEARAAAIDANRHLLENLEIYVSDHPELMDNPDADDWAAKLYVSQVIIEEELRPVLEEHARLEQAQLNLAGRLSLLSPASALDQYFTDVAGTGRPRQTAYAAQVTRFLHAWRDTYAPWIFARRSLSSADIAELPRFSFLEPAIPTRTASTIVGLLCFALAAAALAASRIQSRITRFE